jgi:hypothetical protein
MTYYTIGNMRDDGDMEVVATINLENASYYSDELVLACQRFTDSLKTAGLTILNRQDMPDILEIHS